MSKLKSSRSSIMLAATSVCGSWSAYVVTALRCVCHCCRVAKGKNSRPEDSNRLLLRISSGWRFCVWRRRGGGKLKSRVVILRCVSYASCVQHLLTAKKAARRVSVFKISSAWAEIREVSSSKSELQ
jgi:hypothetical protein